jgi:hypothetical protein
MALPFSVSFGGIEHILYAGYFKLIKQLAPVSDRRFRKLLEKVGSPGNKRQFESVKVEFFVVKDWLHLK